MTSGPKGRCNPAPTRPIHTDASAQAAECRSADDGMGNIEASPTPTSRPDVRAVVAAIAGTGEWLGQFGAIWLMMIPLKPVEGAAV